MRDIERRLEKLEQSYTPQEPVVVTILDFVSPERYRVLGVTSDCGFSVNREPDESEEGLMKRAEFEAKEWHQLHPTPNGLIVLRTVREANS